MGEINNTEIVKNLMIVKSAMEIDGSATLLKLTLFSTKQLQSNIIN